jgi:hypothetical protein
MPHFLLAGKSLLDNRPILKLSHHVDSIIVYLPLDPFTVHIRCLTSNVCLESPFHNSRPIQISFVISYEILRFCRVGYPSTSCVDSRCSCSACQSLSRNEARSKIREIARRVKRFPPCMMYIMLIRIEKKKKVLLKIVVIVVTIRSLEETIEA